MSPDAACVTVPCVTLGPDTASVTGPCVKHGPVVAPMSGPSSGEGPDAASVTGPSSKEGPDAAFETGPPAFGLGLDPAAAAEMVRGCRGINQRARSRRKATRVRAQSSNRSRAHNGAVKATETVF